MSFRVDLERALQARGAALASDIGDFIDHLVEAGQSRTYPRTGETVVIAQYGARPDDTWTNIAFEMPPDMVRHWFGRDDLDAEIIPFICCGADGSYIALWRSENGDRFVFLGSEGATFTVADDPKLLITILTMGYGGIEDRADLDLTPTEYWQTEGDEVPDVTGLQAWAKKRFGITYPDRAGSLLPNPPETDPFTARVADLID